MQSQIPMGLILTVNSFDLFSLIKENSEIIAILCGSILGSIKAHSLSLKKVSLPVKINNITLGIFAGTTVAFHYLNNFHIWGAAITALITSSLSVALIDSLFRISPDIASKLVEKWLGLDMDAIIKPDNSDKSIDTKDSKEPEESKDKIPDNPLPDNKIENKTEEIPKVPEEEVPEVENQFKEL